MAKLGEIRRSMLIASLTTAATMIKNYHILMPYRTSARFFLRRVNLVGVKFLIKKMLSNSMPKHKSLTSQ